jgi:hypothetical protein
MRSPGADVAGFSFSMRSPGADVSARNDELRGEPRFLCSEDHRLGVTRVPGVDLRHTLSPHALRSRAAEDSLIPPSSLGRAPCRRRAITRIRAGSGGGWFLEDRAGVAHKDFAQALEAAKCVFSREPLQRGDADRRIEDRATERHPPATRTGAQMR